MTGLSNENLAIDDSPPHRESGSRDLFSAVRFSQDVVFTFGTRLVMIINSVAAGIIAARWLGVEGVGRLAVINVSVITLVQLGSFGLPSANTYFIANDLGHFRRATINSILFALLGGSMLALALSTLAQVRPSWFGFVAPELFRVAAISIPFQLLILICLNIFLAVGKIREFNLLDLLSQSFVIVNAVVALIVFRAGLGALVTLNSLASVLVGLLVVTLLVRTGKRFLGKVDRWRSDFPLFQEMLKYGIKSHISILASTLIFRADLLVVNWFRGSAEAGVYSLASQMATLLMVLPSVIATLLFPRVTAERDPTGQTTCVVARHTAFIMLICCLAAAPLSLLLPLLYGAAFSDSPVQLIILLPGVYLIGMQSVIVQHFNAMGLPRLVPIFWLVTLAINLILVFLLVKALGARGAALASTISYSLIAFLMLSYFKLETRRPMSEVFVLKSSELRSIADLSRMKMLGDSPQS